MSFFESNKSARTGTGGKRSPWSLGEIVSATLTTVLLVLSLSVSSDAIISVDLGSEWVKIGIVLPGSSVEIVPNPESERKIPLAVAFHDGERLFGKDALRVAVRFPANAYLYFLDLLGKKIDNPIVQVFLRRFPHYKLVADDDRGTVLFQHDAVSIYSPEELLAMILKKCRNYAEDFMDETVREAILTVPPFFNQAERRAVLNAADLAGLKVIHFINTNTAAALHYGISNSEDFGTPKTILLYDMGASSTVATVARYQILVTKENESSVTTLHLSILGVCYNRTLGGLELQLRLRDFFGKAFNDMNKTKKDIFLNPRSMAKLFQEAGQVKNVLSSNTDAFAQVDGLLDGHDFVHKITRQEFQKLWKDLFYSVTTPISLALDAAELSKYEIDQVVIVGAGTRVPKVQDELESFFRRKLSKRLNTDEAAALGAVSTGVDFSLGFKFQKLVVQDAVIFSIMIDGKTVFNSMSAYPQEKVVNVGWQFHFHINYGHFPFALQYEIASAEGHTSHCFARIDLSWPTKATVKYIGKFKPKGLTAHLAMDENGLLSINRVEAVAEITTTDSDSYTVKEPLDVQIKYLDVQPFEGDRFTSAVEKLDTLDHKDKMRTLRDGTKNKLENLVIEVQSKMASEEFKKHLTERDRTKIISISSEISDWLYDEGSHAEIYEYDMRFERLNWFIEFLEDRMREQKQSPYALKTYDQMSDVYNIKITGNIKLQRSRPDSVLII